MVEDLRPHWWFLVPPVSLLVLALLVAIVAKATVDNDILSLFTVVLVLAALVWFVYRYAFWTTTNFAVTSKRLIYRTGIIAKRGIEIPLDRVNTVFFNQSIFERMLGAGDLTIESAGENGTQKFSDISHPNELQSIIYAEMEADQARTLAGAGSGNMGGGQAQSVPQQIEELDSLRQRGIISDAEFQAKKANLLDRM